MPPHKALENVYFSFFCDSTGDLNETLVSSAQFTSPYLYTENVGQLRISNKIKLHSY